MRYLIGWICMLGVMLSGTCCAASSIAEEPPLVLILMGPPGAGKGTHAVPLAERLHIPHISTGDLFRENIRTQSALGKKAKNYIDAGQLVPDEVVLDMLFSRIENSDCKRGYILDGFPRTVSQAQALDRQIQGRKCRILAVSLTVPDALLVERISGRIACKNCGASYHKKYNPPLTEGVCNRCQGALYQRDDDREEILRKRLEVYHAQTKPLIEYYAKQKGVLHEVLAGKSQSDVFAALLETVEGREPAIAR